MWCSSYEMLMQYVFTASTLKIHYIIIIYQDTYRLYTQTLFFDVQDGMLLHINIVFQWVLFKLTIQRNIQFLIVRLRREIEVIVPLQCIMCVTSIQIFSLLHHFPYWIIFINSSSFSLDPSIPMWRAFGMPIGASDLSLQSEVFYLYEILETTIDHLVNDMDKFLICAMHILKNFSVVKL